MIIQCLISVVWYIVKVAFDYLISTIIVYCLVFISWSFFFKSTISWLIIWYRIVGVYLIFSTMKQMKSTCIVIYLLMSSLAPTPTTMTLAPVLCRLCAAGEVFSGCTLLLPSVIRITTLSTPERSPADTESTSFCTRLREDAVLVKPGICKQGKGGRGWN